MLRPKKLKSFLLILSHKNSEFRNKQLDYLKNHSKINNFYYYYFIGDLNLDSEYKIDEDNKTVYLKVPDNYESLSLKVYYAFKFINENFKDKICGIFKTDDDIILNLDSILNLLEDNRNIQYFGNVSKTTSNFSDYHFGKCESQVMNEFPIEIPLNLEYCSGGGYYVKSSEISKILWKKNIFDKVIFEDIAVGISLSDFDINPIFIDIKKNGFFW